MGSGWIANVASWEFQNEVGRVENGAKWERTPINIKSLILSTSIGFGEFATLLSRVDYFQANTLKPKKCWRKNGVIFYACEEW